MSQSVCPHCGQAGDGLVPNVPSENGHAQGNGFYLLEDITAYRFVRGVEGKRLVVDGLYHTGEGYEEGARGTLRQECRRGLTEFALPAAVEIAWQ